MENTTLEEAKARYAEAKQIRDAAVAEVVEAVRRRARDWLMWVAYTVADRNATKVNPTAVAEIKQKVSHWADQAEGRPLKLDYSSVYRDGEEASLFARPYGASLVVDEATKPYVAGLIQSLRTMGFTPGQNADLEFTVSSFKGEDGFSGVLSAWASAEVACRVAKAERTKVATVVAKDGLRDMWGDDAPTQGPPS
jgi:hypothetical protein